MKKTISMIAVFACVTCTRAMDHVDQESKFLLTHYTQPPISTTDHQQEERSLIKQIYHVNQQITQEKTRHAQAIVQAQNKWDNKTAKIALLFAGGIALKTSYDVYIMVSEPTVPDWLTIGNLVFDGTMLAGTAGVGLLHLIRGCCRKPKVE